jgi:hypothetical protein
VRFDDGSLVVADGGSLELRFFTAEGRHLRTVGGKGAGPGEFMTLTALKRNGNAAFAFDGRTAILRSYANDGRLTSENQIIASSRSMDEMHFLGNGKIAVRAPLRPGDQLPPVNGYARSILRIAILDSTGQRLAVLGPFEDSETYSTHIKRDGVTYVANRPIPFGKHAVFAGSDSTVFVGTADAFEISGWGLTGEQTSKIRYDLAPVSVGDEQIAAFARHRSASASNPELEYREIAARASEYGGSIVPPYARMLIDADGYLWLGTYPIETSESELWHVFEESGRFLGAVRTPGNLRLFEIGHDYVLGVSEDSTGVEHVQLHSLSRS